MKKSLLIPISVGTIGIIAGSLISLQKKRTLDEKILEQYGANKVVIFDCKDYGRFEFVFTDTEFKFIQSDFNSSFFRDRVEELGCEHIAIQCSIQADGSCHLYVHPYDISKDEWKKATANMHFFEKGYKDWTFEGVIDDLKKIYKDKKYYIKKVGEIK